MGKQPADGTGPRAFYRKARRRVSRSGPVQLPPSESLPFQRAAGTTHQTLARPSLFSRSAMEQFNSPNRVAAFRSRSQRKERHSPGIGLVICPLADRSEEHTSELQSRLHLVCRLLLEKKKQRHPISA